jgi:Putative beta-barrel porin 2
MSPLQATGQASASSFERAGVGWLPAIPIQLTAGLDMGYDDNVNLTPGGGGSLFTRENLVLNYNFPSARTQFYLIGVGRFSQFFDVTGQNETAGNITMSLTHNFSTRLSFYTSVYASYQNEPNLQSNIGPENVRAAHFDTGNIFSLTYHWLPRFSTVTSFTLDRVQYSASSSVGASQNRTEYTLGEELQFSLTSRTNLTGQYRFDVANYDSAPLNSVTHYLLAGVDHHLTEHLLIRAQGGESVRSLENQGSSSSPYVQSSLAYVSSNHSLNWTTSYGFEAPTATGATTTITWRTGLSLTYNLTSRLSSSTAVFYHHDQNTGGAGSTGSQDSFDLLLGLRYTVNNRFAIHADYTHSMESSLGSTAGYSRSSYSAGFTYIY